LQRCSRRIIVSDNDLRFFSGANLVQAQSIYPTQKGRVDQ